MNAPTDSSKLPVTISEIVPRVNEGGRRGADERDRIRRALDHAYFYGPDGEWLKEQIWARLDQAPESIVSRRKAAVLALKEYYAGSNYAISECIAHDLLKYRCSSDWRRDKNLKTAPPSYLPREAIFFAILKDSGPDADVPKARTIRGILDGRGKVGQIYTIQMANQSVHPLDENLDEGRTPMKPILHSDQQFLEVLRRSPEVEKIVTDEAARVTAERQKIRDAIAALDAKAEREFPKFEKVVQSIIAERSEIEKALRAVNDRLNAAAAAKSGASGTYTMDRHRLENQLREGADARLFDEFLYDMRTELDAARKKYVGGTVLVRNRATRKDESVGYNNAASVNCRLSAINAAMEEAEKLRLAADQSSVAEHLAALRAGLPEIEPPVIPTVHSKN